jgi:hypothetical protein
MGFFDSIGKALGSIGRAIFPESMSDIGDIGDLNDQSLARANQSLKLAQEQVENLDQTFSMLSSTIAGLNAELQRHGFQEPVFAHGSIEEALRQR